MTDLLAAIPQLGAWLLELALIAVLGFWVMGAYNRLMRHRNAIGTAWAQIDDLLVRRAAVIEPLADALQGPLEAEAKTLAALSQALARQRAAALVVRGRPTQASALTAWAAAEGELASPLTRLDALVAQHPELAGSDEVKPLRKQLADLAPRLTYARQAFNEAADAYNQALEEFPTRLLKPLFGFRRTARI
jgi:LemA protein